MQRFKAGRERAKYMTAVSALSEAMTSIAVELSDKDRPSLGKLGAIMRGALRQLEELEPIIAAGAKVENNDQRFDPAACVDAMSKAFELEARLDGLIEKTIQRFVVARECLSQYARKSPQKLITHASAAKQMIATNAAKTKIEDDLDDDNDNDNYNDNDNEEDGPNPDKYDWEHEYDADMKEWRRAQRKKDRDAS